MMDRFLLGIYRRWLPAGVLWQVSTREKVVYLTFDDGPIPELTREILEILDQYNAKATFFCVGENVRKHPSLFREIMQKGHAVGNHTNFHVKGTRGGFNRYMEDIRQAGALIDTTLFRPPHGLITRRQVKVLSKEFRIVMWSVLTRDFDRQVNPEECLKRAINGIRPGAIIVFHDNLKAREKVLFTLPRLLEYLGKEGYRAETLGQVKSK